MSIVQVLFLVLLWGIPIFRFIHFYLKQNKEDREELKKGMKSPSFLFVDGVRYIGLSLFFTGLITSINVIQHSGAVLLFIGWFSVGIEMWDKSIKRSFILMSFGIIGAGAYYFIVI